MVFPLFFKASICTSIIHATTFTIVKYLKFTNNFRTDCLPISELTAPKQQLALVCLAYQYSLIKEEDRWIYSYASAHWILLIKIDKVGKRWKIFQAANIYKFLYFSMRTHFYF